MRSAKLRPALFIAVAAFVATTAAATLATGVVLLDAAGSAAEAQTSSRDHRPKPFNPRDQRKHAKPVPPKSGGVQVKVSPNNKRIPCLGNLC